jgi:hypothetical protein
MKRAINFYIFEMSLDGPVENFNNKIVRPFAEIGRECS